MRRPVLLVHYHSDTGTCARTSNNNLCSDLISEIPKTALIFERMHEERGGLSRRRGKGQAAAGQRCRR